jgi:hypothetical protein
VPDLQESIHRSGVDDSETMGSVANLREIAITLIDPSGGGFECKRLISTIRGPTGSARLGADSRLRSGSGRQASAFSFIDGAQVVAQSPVSVESHFVEEKEPALRPNICLLHWPW